MIFSCSVAICGLACLQAKLCCCMVLQALSWAESGQLKRRLPLSNSPLPLFSSLAHPLFLCALLHPLEKSPACCKEM